MTDYISREAALEELNTPITMSVCLGKADLAIKRMQRDRDVATIRAVPAADVVPVVHAEWKINADGYYPYCSACKKEPPGRSMTAYCPNCGAVMDGGAKDETD